MKPEHRVHQAPQIVTARTLMRAHRPDDLDAMVALWADERVTRFITGRPSTRSETWSRLLRYVGHWQALGFGYWAVEDRETGYYIGEVGFADFKREIEPPLGSVPEAGWALTPEVHGKGIATEVMSAALDWTDSHFVEPGTVCIIDPEHKASMQVAKKLGYQFSHVATFMERPSQIMSRGHVGP